MQEMQEMRVQSLGQEDPLEEGRAAHSSTLAWKIPRTEEPGGLQSIGPHKGGHGWSNLAQHSSSHVHKKYLNKWMIVETNML